MSGKNVEKVSCDATEIKQKIRPLHYIYILTVKIIDRLLTPVCFIVTLHMESVSSDKVNWKTSGKTFTTSDSDIVSLPHYE